MYELFCKTHDLLVLCLDGADGAHNGEDIVVRYGEGLALAQRLVKRVPIGVQDTNGGVALLLDPVGLEGGLISARRAEGGTGGLGAGGDRLPLLGRAKENLSVIGDMYRYE